MFVFVIYDLESDKVFLAFSLKEVINAFKVSFNVSRSGFVPVERADPVFDLVSAVPKCLSDNTSKRSKTEIFSLLSHCFDCT